MNEDRNNLINDEKCVNINFEEGNTTNLFNEELAEALNLFEPVEGGTLSPTTLNYEDCIVIDRILEVLNFKKDTVNLVKLLRGGYKLDTEEV